MSTSVEAVSEMKNKSAVGLSLKQKVSLGLIRPPYTPVEYPHRTIAVVLVLRKTQTPSVVSSPNVDTVFSPVPTTTVDENFPIPVFVMVCEPGLMLIGVSFARLVEIVMLSEIVIGIP